MIECIFTLDYEIYGNGEGSLRELVYEPAERLGTIFKKFNARFMPFVEVAEFEMIEAMQTDPAIDQVRQQIRDFHREEFELGLHIHPQWYKAKRENGKWVLDYGEYNMCTLPRDRIEQIIDRAIAYLRDVTGVLAFTPLSFRAGNWLLQPAKPAVNVLAERGIKLDSSVFKGGLRHEHGLDYRRALKNGYYWNFANRADVPDRRGHLTEVPIYTRMVPIWKLISSKRVNLEQKGASGQTGRQKLYRFLDMLRFFHPLKLDFCRMTLAELTGMIDEVIREDGRSLSVYKPIVAIGHTKELSDIETVEALLSYLEQKGIQVTTFKHVYSKCGAVN